MRKTALFVVATAAAGAAFGAPVRVGVSDYAIEKEVLDGAGGEVTDVTSTSYILTTVVAQPHAGYSESGNYVTSTGFLHPMNAPGNTPPSLDPVATPQVVDEGGSLQFTLTAADWEAPPQVLAYLMSGEPANSSLDPGTGEFTYWPAMTQGGSVDTVTFLVSDGHGGRDSQDVVIYTINTDSPGDLNGDGFVNMGDFYVIDDNWSTPPSDPAWDPRSDANGDGVSNLSDLMIVARNWLKEY